MGEMAPGGTPSTSECPARPSRTPAKRRSQDVRRMTVGRLGCAERSGRERLWDRPFCARMRQDGGRTSCRVVREEGSFLEGRSPPRGGPPSIPIHARWEGLLRRASRRSGGELPRSQGLQHALHGTAVQGGPAGGPEQALLSAGIGSRASISPPARLSEPSRTGISHRCPQTFEPRPRALVKARLRRADKRCNTGAAIGGDRAAAGAGGHKLVPSLKWLQVLVWTGDVRCVGCSAILKARTLIAGVCMRTVHGMAWPAGPAQLSCRVGSCWHCQAGCPSWRQHFGLRPGRKPEPQKG
eukprot:261993-Chlamydomonas_euryale.AAC.3